MEAISSSETSVLTRVTLSHIPEDSIFFMVIAVKTSNLTRLNFIAMLRQRSDKVLRTMSHTVKGKIKIISYHVLTVYF
jgi:hypothetical protein